MKDALFKQPSTKERDLQIGEDFAARAKHYGELAAKYLFRGQWSYKEPEWFDHRLHLLDPENQFNDFWTMSAANVIQVLPYGGTLLDLCSGDGWYDYHFYRHRASVINCVEKDPVAMDQAVRLHSYPNITYILGNVLSFAPVLSSYDVVLLRGAVEHFSIPDQQRIFQIAYSALKPDGYFCGDTVAKRPEQDKMHACHEAEWVDEDEARAALGKVFSKIEVWSLISTPRTTIFWRCQK